jgi:hypothetical protein
MARKTHGKPAVISSSGWVSYIGVESDLDIPDGTTVAKVEAQDEHGNHVADFDFDSTPIVIAKKKTCITITLFGVKSGILFKKKNKKKLAKITILDTPLDPGQISITLTLPDGTSAPVDPVPVNYVSVP